MARCSAKARIPLAAVYDQLGSFLLLGIVAPVALAKVSGGARATLPELARRVLFFPPFAALPDRARAATASRRARGFADRRRRAARAARHVRGRAQAALLAAATGARVRARARLKLFLFPCAAWLVARALGAQGLLFKVAVLETAMPTMITAGALLMAYDVASELAAAFVSWGLILSLLTVPAWSLIVR